MTIDDIRILPVADLRHPELIASASFMLGGCFAVHGVRLIRARRRDLAVMPQVVLRGKRLDVAFPTNPAFRERLTAALFDAYAARVAASVAS